MLHNRKRSAFVSWMSAPALGEVDARWRRIRFARSGKPGGRVATMPRSWSCVISQSVCSRIQLDSFARCSGVNVSTCPIAKLVSLKLPHRTQPRTRGPSPPSVTAAGVRQTGQICGSLISASTAGRGSRRGCSLGRGASCRGGQCPCPCHRPEACRVRAR